MNTAAIVKRALLISVIVIAIGGTVAALVAGFVVGPRAVGGVIVGAAVALLYSALTTVAVLIGTKRQGTEMMVIIMGSWMVKLVLFVIIIMVIKATHLVDLSWCFWALVGASIIGLLVDMFVMLKAREPYVDVLLPGEER